MRLNEPSFRFEFRLQAGVGDEPFELPFVGAPGGLEVVGKLAWVELGEAATDDPAVELGAEEDEPAALLREPVAERAGQTLEEALPGEAAEVVGHLARAVRSAEMVADEDAQRSTPDVGRRPAKVGQGAEEGDDARIAEAQTGGSGGGRTRRDW